MIPIRTMVRTARNEVPARNQPFGPGPKPNGSGAVCSAADRDGVARSASNCPDTVIEVGVLVRSAEQLRFHDVSWFHYRNLIGLKKITDLSSVPGRIRRFGARMSFPS